MTILTWYLLEKAQHLKTLLNKWPFHTTNDHFNLIFTRKSTTFTKLYWISDHYIQQVTISYQTTLPLSPFTRVGSPDHCWFRRTHHPHVFPPFFIPLSSPPHSFLSMHVPSTTVNQYTGIFINTIVHCSFSVPAGTCTQYNRKSGHCTLVILLIPLYIGNF